MGVEAKIERADGMALAARFFNAGYLRRHLIPGEWFLWEGRTDDAKVGLLIHPSFVHLPGGAAQALPEEPPVRVAYRAPEGVSERTMRELADTCLTEHLSTIADPAGEVDAASWQAAIRDLHRPPDAAAHAAARRLMAARELLALAWRMQERRARQTGVAGRAWNWSDQVHERALARLPFTLTDGQRQAVAEIRGDLQVPAPMYRLLNGDVGSGKTAVALLAMLAVVADGAQAVLLAPTAVLANQHALFIDRCLHGSRVRTALLTGGTSTEERATILASAANGSLGILIGTHALLEDAVQLKALGLLVIDEQHKFGVEQRGALIARAETAQGWRPDLLLMTATPIPRTLALTAFGDLAVSRIAGRPPGRAPVTTSQGTFSALTQLDDPIRQALTTNGQVFVICPLREASERVTAADAERVHAHLTAALAPLQIGLLYGAMAEAQKLSLMSDFAAGRTRVLVSTTVVEVGIDVPAATLLIVLDAERFGLAQLHQLRGRIGRGHRPGHCLLFTRKDSRPADGGCEVRGTRCEVEQPTATDDHDSPQVPSGSRHLAPRTSHVAPVASEAQQRLRVLIEHDDGLAIAEADLATRGPGQLLGTGQHGSLALKVAELPRDLDLLQSAHQRARERIAAGDTLPPLLPRLLGGDEAVLAGG